MGDKLGALPACNLDLTAADAGPCYRSAQQVSVLIDGIGLNCGPDEVLHKLWTQVFNENLHRNGCKDTEQGFVLNLWDIFMWETFNELFIRKKLMIVCHKNSFVSFCMWCECRKHCSLKNQNKAASDFHLLKHDIILEEAVNLLLIIIIYSVSYLLCTKAFRLFPGFFKIFILPNVSLEKHTFNCTSTFSLELLCNSMTNPPYINMPAHDCASFNSARPWSCHSDHTGWEGVTATTSRRKSSMNAT